MTDWPGDTQRILLEAGVRQVAYVPDAGHKELIALCSADRAMTAVPLTTEEEGIALLAGAWLGGERGVLLMQSSGVGNCINMLSLTKTCRFPLLMLVTMRGQWGEFNPWQVPMGQSTEAHLKLADVVVHHAETADQVAGHVAAGARLCFESHVAVAVLIDQRVLGIKTFGR